EASGRQAVARSATRRAGKTVGARGRALRPGPKPRPRRQGAGDATPPVEAAVGAAQTTVDDAADARGAADETRRRARSVPHALAPGLTPRSVLEKFAAMQMIDVHLPTTDGRELVLTRYTEPEPELSLLLEKLKLELPAQPPPKITAGPVPPTPL